ncbi:MULTISPECIES: N-acyl homoserine lactonase family protein [unclassified Streptomyces]|uniref:N-acyl homoserine lactonase family protein n=1 Tax=unclassified Streptomyces TaxID=2593676 RepID=UPI002E17913A|nr:MULTISPECIES: N-acyl homoserine lactonase family protein [unclassified Streptomyces]
MTPTPGADRAVSWDGDGTYEVYALRYASRPGHKAREYYGFEKYGEPDVPYAMDYFYWLVRNPFRTVLVDCGYDRSRGERRGMFASHEPGTDPLDVLGLVGVTPESVDHVVLSHLHLDHVGNVHRFPNATFSLARQELDFWTGYTGSRELLAHVVHPEEIDLVRGLLDEGRVRLVEESTELFPGITATRIGGHTPGQLMTEVTGTGNRVVLASDAVHFYEEFEADRPFWLFTDLVETYGALALLRGLDSAPDTSVVPGHDPRVMERFATVHQGRVVDLNRPLV